MPILASRELGEGITATLQEAVGGNYVVSVTTKNGEIINVTSFGRDYTSAKEDYESWRAQ